MLGGVVCERGGLGVGLAGVDVEEGQLARGVGINLKFEGVRAEGLDGSGWLHGEAAVGVLVLYLRMGGRDGQIIDDRVDQVACCCVMFAETREEFVQ